ncbi:DNA double-strand break repair helicase HerA [Metallosphaera sedula]|uniref:DNA double-strand break repair helicase HerA n=1 Tax=Metallosphaera sedula TaxID=43687 RepID=UPI0020769AE3|nr:DNA double-strand break repair helicase HerA [Metallosphaera sedula]BBL46774.1 DNA double-strand break repair helicase HerA [Metallosphaera sedula]
MVIGYVIGEATPQEALMLAEKPVRVGRYVVLEYDGVKVLGLVTSVTRGSPLLDLTLNDIKIVQKLKNLDTSIPQFVKAKIKLLHDMMSGTIPDLPPGPGTPVRFAEEDELRDIFSDGDVMIGSVIGMNIPVKIRVNSLSRHLAILAATGSGKSNTVAVLSQSLASIGGSVVIFDYHGEYYGSDIKPLNNIEPKLNPLHLKPKEFATLLEIRPNATIQYRFLRNAFVSYIDGLRERLKEGNVDYNMLNSEFVSELEREIDEQLKDEKQRSQREAADEVKNKLEEFVDRYGDVIDLTVPDITTRIRPSSVNVVDISHMDEDAMDAVVSHYLRRLLDSRKEFRHKGTGLGFPVVAVIEEAHVFLSKNQDTLTKYHASKIAREGRKFGVSMVIVSQRPKGLDETILSQMTNKIILRMVEPTDKKYVLEASDNLTEDLVEQLSSLGVGEAIMIGNLVKLPAFVRISRFTGRLGGSDPDIRGEWSHFLNARNVDAEFG